jgi:hypothetical protein
MRVVLLVFDIATVALTFLAAYLWFNASHTRHRRISRGETLDAADLNRIIVELNRSQIANERAALATGAAGAALAVRLLLDLLLA